MIDKGKEVLMTPRDKEKIRGLLNHMCTVAKLDLKIEGEVPVGYLRLSTVFSSDEAQKDLWLVFVNCDGEGGVSVGVAPYDSFLMELGDIIRKVEAHNQAMMESKNATLN